MRKDYIDWDNYFMMVSIISGKRSKDPSTQVGACIVNEEKKIIGVGYNGLPNGCKDEDYPWDSREGKLPDTKYPYICHAELNAILNATTSVKGAIIYVSLFPCNECAKAIIQSGIKEIVYLSDKYKDTDTDKISRRMLDDAGVKYRKMKLSHLIGLVPYEEDNKESIEDESKDIKDIIPTVKNVTKAILILNNRDKLISNPKFGDYLYEGQIVHIDGCPLYIVEKDYKVSGQMRNMMNLKLFARYVEHHFFTDSKFYPEKNISLKICKNNAVDWEKEIKDFCQKEIYNKMDNIYLFISDIIDNFTSICDAITTFDKRHVFTLIDRDFSNVHKDYIIKYPNGCTIDLLGKLESSSDLSVIENIYNKRIKK